MVKQRKSFFNSSFSKSFSLVELLLVLVLVSTLAALSLPQFHQAHSRIILKTQAQNLSYLLKFAQNQSLAHHKPHRIRFSSDFTRYWLEEEDEDTFKRFSGRWGRVFVVPTGVSMIAERDTIDIFDNGLIEKTVIYFFDNEKNYYTVSTMEERGNVQVFDFKK